MYFTSGFFATGLCALAAFNGVTSIAVPGQDSADALLANNLEKRQAPQQLPPMIVTMVINRIGNDLADTIAKYSAAGKPLPTKEKMAATIKLAMKKSSADAPIKGGQAVKAAIDSLATGESGGGDDSGDKEAPPSDTPAAASGKKLAARQQGGAATPPTKEPATKSPKSPKGKDTDQAAMDAKIDEFAARLLDTIKAFLDAKASGGGLPTGPEISQVIATVLQKNDPTTTKQAVMNKAIHQGLLDLAASKKGNSKTSGAAPPTKSQSADTPPAN